MLGFRDVFFASLLGALFACRPGGSDARDAGAMAHGSEFGGDDKAKLNNLIGRWYPTSEVKRLRDESVTPEEWCKREPAQITVIPDQVEVLCPDGTLHTAALARVRTATGSGDITLLLRVAKDRPLRYVRFQSWQGATAIIAGLPCFDGRPEPHQRFPEYEILTRQILNGRRCSQLEAAAANLRATSAVPAVPEPTPGPAVAP